MSALAQLAPWAAYSVALWGGYTLLRRREPVPVCGEPHYRRRKVSCSQLAGHAGEHMYYEPGTGQGDSLLVLWP